MKKKDPKRGMILRDKDGCQHMIRGFRGKYIIMSKRNDFNKNGYLWTIEEINERQNTIIN